MNQYSSAAIRYTVVLLFLWFAIAQLINPGMWTTFLPEWTGYFPIPGEILVRLNGLAELLLAILLAAGVYTRIVSGLLGLHLFMIAITAGGAIGVRDAALAFVAFALAGTPADKWTVDNHSA